MSQKEKMKKLLKILHLLRRTLKEWKMKNKKKKLKIKNKIVTRNPLYFLKNSFSILFFTITHTVGKNEKFISILYV